ncbi:MAG: helix-turn-helix transcriptional regulator [Clostridia bacterium]|nr:helix-turn-helix transcriptional regulator [Clostridia bacterium]
MCEELFKKRLIELRMNKGVSARDMSLSIGQSESYINKIENTTALPSMSVFFYICEYLGVTPSEFFDADIKNPVKLKSVIEDLKQLDDKQLDTIAELVKGLKKR